MAQIERSDDNRPTVNQDRFTCPRCGTFAYQNWAALTFDGARLEPTKPSSGRTANFIPRELWRAARCHACNDPSVWRDETMIYPRPQLGSEPHKDMADEVRSLYEEAAMVAAVSRRAGAALARATVERLVKLLDPQAPEKATLDKRLDRIRPRVSSSLAEMLEVVRYLGNKMLHVEEPESLGELVVLALDDDEGPPLVELLLETANDLVEELVTKPKMAAVLRDQLPQHVRKKLESIPPADASTD